MKKSVLGALSMLSLAACASNVNQNPIDAEISRLNQQKVECLSKANRDECLAQNFNALKAATSQRLAQFSQNDPRRLDYTWVEPYKPGDEPGHAYDPPSVPEMVAGWASQKLATCINSYSCGIVFGR